MIKDGSGPPSLESDLRSAIATYVKDIDGLKELVEGDPENGEALSVSFTRFQAAIINSLNRAIESDTFMIHKAFCCNTCKQLE